MIYDYYQRAYVRGSGQGTAVILSRHGIGDDIMILPALHSLLKTSKVTVFTKEFSHPLYEKLGCEVYPLLDGDDSSYIMGDCYIGKESFNLNETFKDIYYLDSWSCWSYNKEGKPTELLNEIHRLLRAPKSDFSYTNFYRSLGIKQENNYILYAPESHSQWRQSYKRIRTFLSLWLKGRVVYVSQRKRFYTHKAETIIELLQITASARKVVTCDTGILHIALSMGKDTVAQFGCTDEHFVAGYDKKPVVVRADGCNRCHMHPSNGFINGLCKGLYRKPMCMTNQSVLMLLKQI